MSESSTRINGGINEMDNPFRYKLIRYVSGKTEFECFRDSVTLEWVTEIAENDSHFKVLEKYCSFLVKSFGPDTVQVWFGSRSMFRQDTKGRTLIENGATLVYSLGANGAVVCVLYPAASEIAKPLEECIYLRVGHYGRYQLFSRLRRDLHDLIAYHYVTSLDTTATLNQRIRVGWLRRVHPMQVNGQYKPALTVSYVAPITKFTVGTLIGALVRIAIFLSGPAILTYLGLSKAFSF